MHVAKMGRVFALVAGTAIVASPVVALPASATPVSDNVVINEIYVRGGSEGSAYKYKYVELYNQTDHEIDLTGMKLGYYTSKGNLQQSGFDLAGTIAPKSHFLIKGQGNGKGGGDFDADLELKLNPGANVGALGIAAAGQELPKNASEAEAANLIDLVGWGTSKGFEKAPAAAKSSDTTSIQRTTDGADTNDNSVDFAVKDVTPKSTKGDVVAKPADPSDTPTPKPTTPTKPTFPTGPAEEVTIAQIQGTGAASEIVGKYVKTKGVVTASYPTGGFFGFVIQTPGTGEQATDASQAVFVYANKEFGAFPEIGQYVEVTGLVTEFGGLTEITGQSFTKVEGAFEAPKPVKLEKLPATDEAREKLESMLLDFTGPLTVADVYSTNTYGELGLAFGTTPLRQPSDQFNPATQAAEIAQLAAENDARKIILDDGLSWAYMMSKNPHPEIPLAYLSTDKPVRVGAAVTFKKPVILDYRTGGKDVYLWKLQPIAPVTSAETGDISADYVTFENTRKAAPADVKGDISVSSFNVLNYFTDLGEDEGCTKFYTDRENKPVTTKDCKGRGAYTKEAFERQQTKIVNAINTLDATVVSLEEIENSEHFNKDRDDSLSKLVAALNAKDSSKNWDYVRTPAVYPKNADFIRLAFIYQKDKVKPVGDSKILMNNDFFTNAAREPLGQEFQAVKDGKDFGQSFVVVVNHFKSKGSLSSKIADDTDFYAGNNNKLRTKQAEAMVSWVSQNYAGKPVVIVGDLNSYKAEDPVKAIEKAGYTELTTHFNVDKHSYLFGGLVGSLDHALVNDKALAMVTGVDVWNINAMESVALEYSRYNYNVKNLYDETPFRSSDHDPVKIGLKLDGTVVPDPEPQPKSCTETNSCTAYVSNDLMTSVAKAGAILAKGDVLAGDWDGDGVDTFAVRNGQTLTIYAKDGSTTERSYPDAATGKVYAGDVDGDKKADLIVRHGNELVVLTADGKRSTTSYGRAGDEFFVGDWNGDGVDTFGIRRGNLVMLRNAPGGGVADVETYGFGRVGDVAVAGDWDGDGKDTVSVRRANILYIKNTLAGGEADATYSYGKVSDTLVAGDWDGNKTDTPAAVRR